MKTIYFTAILLALGIDASMAQTSPTQTTSSPPGQTNIPAPTPYQVVDRGANYKVWQRTIYEKMANGKTVSHVHSYTELASGMHYKDASGNWTESQDLIEAFPQGAIAQHGQYQVIFANNLNSAGAIDQQTPDGKRLRSNILGLAYYDSGSGQSVMIGEIQDSQGELISSNQVLYPNAFDGVKADVRYTYKKGTFEQDVILREQPPTPESLGLNSATTEIQVLTEFINPPALVAVNAARTSKDEQDISWGVMVIGRGRTFDLARPQADAGRLIPVERDYVTMEGRNILVEKVPLKFIRASLSRLPLHAAIKSHNLKTASRHLPLPKTPLAASKVMPMQMASTTFDNHGYVLDYVEINIAQDSYTFQADTTYLITAEFGIGPGLTVFEGGTVIKFDTKPGNDEEPRPGSDAIDLYGAVVCDSSPYRPVVFTSINDDSVGESTFSSGASLEWFFAPAGGPSALNFNWHDIRVKYAYYGMFSHEGQMNNCQFVNCLYPIVMDTFDGGTYAATNILIVNADAAFSGVGFNANVYHLTVDGCTNLLLDWDAGTDNTISLTNSLLVNVQNTGDGSIQSNYTASVTGSVFQPIGGGNCYLPAGSPYLAAGTTNVDPNVLLDIAGKTTSPPLVYSNVMLTTNLILSPLVSRENGLAPDLGYHYDPIDYLFGGVCFSNASLTLAPGTVIGTFGLDTFSLDIFYAIDMEGGGQFYSHGLANNLNRLVDCSTVQEESFGAGINTISLVDVMLGLPAGASFDFRFTMFSGLAEEVLWIFENTDTGGFRDCEVYAGQVESDTSALNSTNCLYFRDYYLDPSFGNTPKIFNNLVWGGIFQIQSTNALIENNAFDSLTNLFLRGSGSNNAYINMGSYHFFTNDITVTNELAYQTGPFGSFYQPTNSPLINAGSITADQVNLYHFTTQTNQTVEGNSIVDIGYHYVATDINGNPLDSNGDGIADYLEDANGNGIFDAGDLGEWQISPYGLNSGNALQVFTPLK